ncbi:uncharacterized protein EI90DRAFT_2965738 [Cantharellus anzutake]|uniref:uncharacterized protein n=1 Tax=Cantharellus anzutake TaxID=1750568 RepID=UPI001904A956|nr:uncharacterized protein EI90DRAFT_2965738 [Cantharellus anzutake]KAF8341384.1 hypothetical protein EI90DRAFT_2965738 [Cantharellus anzutake]
MAKLADPSPGKTKKGKRHSLAAPTADTPAVANSDAVVKDVDMEDGEAKDVKKTSKKEKIPTIPPGELLPIAKPLADHKLNKKVEKLISRARKVQRLRRGIKEVVKSIRKGEKGVLVLAADLSPIDVISHLPILAEEAQIPYIYVVSKEALGRSASTKRPTSCVLVSTLPSKKQSGASNEEDETELNGLYEECAATISNLDEHIVY